MRFTHRTTTTLVLQRDSAPGLASPTAHLSGDCASSGLPRIFRRAYAGVSYLSTSRTPSVTIYTTRIDAPGPSFTPSSTCIAAITVLRCDWDGRPTVPIGLSVRAVRALRHLFVTCCSSPRVNVRPWDEFTRRECTFGPGTNSQTGRERRTSR